MSHTKGPWHINTHNVPTGQGDFIPVLAVECKTHMIASFIAPEAEDEANAALIAAAPDLLTVALAVQGEPYITSETYDLATKALQKALGTEP